MLSTKARTLESLKDTVRQSTVAPLDFFSVAQWQTDAEGIVTRLMDRFGDDALIVRSSALGEDGAAHSLAGHFISVLNVRGAKAVKQAVDRVIASYHADTHEKNEVLVQPMVPDVTLSGVVLTHDPSTAAPYRVINYATGGDTTAVTSGAGATRGFVCSRGADSLPDELRPVIRMVDELEAIFPDTPLDVEFALSQESDKPALLQVRPLVLTHADCDAATHQKILERIANWIEAAQGPHPFLHGKSTVFGVMPDWNPAEIIGIRPRPLALSLYRDLVTDSIWAYQRHNYGYRNLRSFPLVVHFAGLPYIDVRLSFNSFVPRDVDGSLADRLVDYYVDRLVAAPSLHDKIEFEIVFSCYTLDLPDRLEGLKEFGFNRRERQQLADSLRALTNRIIDRDKGLWRQDAAKLDRLVKRREEIMASDLDPVSRIYWLLEDCKRYGTLPFAGLARAGFIAVQMLKSLVAVGLFSHDDYDLFMNDLSTVSSQFTRDLATMDRASFLSRYGHLRPGTYDILSKRYDEAPEDYLGTVRGKGHSNENPKPFALSLVQMRRLSDLLEKHGLASDVVGLLDFLQAGIEQREYAKFIFTRNLSDALSLFREWGTTLGLTPDDLSYAHIGCVRELYASADEPRAVLMRSIEEGRERHAESCQIRLPPLITRPQDVFAFEISEAEPNFVTQSCVTAPVGLADQRKTLEGKIAFISSADPGYDWLFSHRIAGLVTAYGGVNSHMAIRANELGLPAVIGAGEILFEKWSRAQKLYIDCAAKRVEILS